jgi:hypothetical protein
LQLPLRRNIFMSFSKKFDPEFNANFIGGWRITTSNPHLRFGTTFAHRHASVTRCQSLAGQPNSAIRAGLETFCKACRGFVPSSFYGRPEKKPIEPEITSDFRHK